MKNFNAIRTLARSNYWQIIYARSKEYNGIKLFDNDSNFTPLQISFLQWLETYSCLDMDISIKEKNISQEVINDDVRCDAYLYWRSIKDKNKDEKKSQEGYEAPPDVPSVMFKRG